METNGTNVNDMEVTDQLDGVSIKKGGTANLTQFGG